ncbi:MAG: transposase [Patescibacteria group bacterium]
MATNRKLVFQNGSLYHIFNRGIERRTVFQDIREFRRALELISFYNHKNIPIRYSQFLQLSLEARDNTLKKLSESERLVDVLAFCLMPNHFHFLFRQKTDNGISTFISNFTNSFTKYFNTKCQRLGPLFEGVFKAVFVESDEQLIHLSRYIHLNPVASSIVNNNQLVNYKWSSYSAYLSLSKDNKIILDRETVLSFFKNSKQYEKFVLDQADYGKQLEKIKHLTLE